MELRTLDYVAVACEGELIPSSSAATVSRVCTDSRQAGPGDLFIALAGERFDAHSFLPEVARQGVAAIVAQRGKVQTALPVPVILVDDTRRALGRLAAHYRSDFSLPVVAVGGSNGKTTTKELIASVLRQAKNVLWSEASFNNDIGVPVTLLKLTDAHQAAVIEAGTNHPGELASLLQIVSPSFGVVTNIGREHLEFFDDLAGVAQEEGAMAEALPAAGVLFLNGDNEWSDSLARRTCARVVRVGLSTQNDFRAESVQFCENGVSFLVTSRHSQLTGSYQVSLLGRHQVVNSLFAIAIGAELGLNRKQIQRGVSECVPAKMRLQLWNFNGVRVLEDCYNANADSMLAALQTLREMPCQRRRVAVLGDMGELGECSQQAHIEVGRLVATGGVDQLFAVGQRAAAIAMAAEKNGLKNAVSIAQVEAAAPAVKEFVRPGDLVLIKASRAMRLERITEILKNGTNVKSPGRIG